MTPPRRKVTAYGRRGINFVKTRDVAFIPSSTNDDDGDELSEDAQTAAAPTKNTDTRPITSFVHLNPTRDRQINKENRPAPAQIPDRATKKPLFLPETPPPKSLLRVKQFRVGAKSPLVNLAKFNSTTGRSPLGVKSLRSAPAPRKPFREKPLDFAPSSAPSIISISDSSDLGPTKPPPRTRTAKSSKHPIVLSSDDDEPLPALAPKKKISARQRKIVISSDEESDIQEVPVPKPAAEALDLRAAKHKSTARKSNDPVPTVRRSSVRRGTPSRVSLTRPSRSHPAVKRSSTTITSSIVSQDDRRNARGTISTVDRKEVTVVATETGHGKPAAKDILEGDPLHDMAVVIDTMEVLSVNAPPVSSVLSWDGIVPSSQSFLQEPVASTPVVSELSSLLQKCGQTEVQDFDAFVSTFAFDGIHGKRAGKVAFRKLGEASYSEVFAVGEVVLKVVPLLLDGEASSEDVEIPCASPLAEVEREILVTKAMGDVHAGFIKLLKVFLVNGSYPAHLLELWDEYESAKGSENVRPDILPPSTHYAIIVLPNGGLDLESFVFSEKIGWQQAASIWWQTARALGQAEADNEFEHRDLHWGQILVKDDPKQVGGLKATIIDLGLSRMQSLGGEVYFAEFDDEIFEGKGDYQFDVYRLMKKHSGGNWKAFNPFTNVLWLHYLAVKLIKHKDLTRPGATKGSSTRSKTTVKPDEGEWLWYDTLVEIESYLAKAAKPSRGKRTVAVPQSSIEVMTWITDRMKE